MKTHVLSTCASQMIGFTKENNGFCSPDLPELQIALPTLRLGLFQLELKTNKNQARQHNNLKN